MLRAQYSRANICEDDNCKICLYGQPERMTCPGCGAPTGTSPPLSPPLPSVPSLYLLTSSFLFLPPSLWTYGCPERAALDITHHSITAGDPLSLSLLPSSISLLSFCSHNFLSILMTTTPRSARVVIVFLTRSFPLVPLFLLSPYSPLLTPLSHPLTHPLSQVKHVKACWHWR